MSRTYLGTRGDAGWTDCSRSDCKRSHAEHREHGDAILCPVTPETLTDETIHALHPTAYGGITGEFECTLEEQLDCYRADGTYECSPAERLAARQRICDAINARLNGAKP